MHPWRAESRSDLDPGRIPAAVVLQGLSSLSRSGARVAAIAPSSSHGRGRMGQPAPGPVIQSRRSMDPIETVSDSSPSADGEPLGSEASASDAEIDLALVERFKAGDKAAFEELVSRYSQKVLTLATYFLKDSEEAYDVAQEVFLKMHRSLHKFRGDSKLSTWIHTIGVNTCKNKLSFWKRLTMRRRQYEEARKVLEAPWTPQDEAEASERVRLIREHILALPENFRLVLILKDLKGYSYEEIAEVLNLRQGTVKSRLHRAREALAARLGPILRNEGSR